MECCQPSRGTWPVLVFVRQINRPGALPNREKPHSVLCLDKRSGRVVYENDHCPGRRFWAPSCRATRLRIPLLDGWLESGRPEVYGRAGRRPPPPAMPAAAARMRDNWRRAVRMSERVESSTMKSNTMESPTVKTLLVATAAATVILALTGRQGPRVASRSEGRSTGFARPGVDRQYAIAAGALVGQQKAAIRRP